jgi:proline dehydrogenase
VSAFSRTVVAVAESAPVRAIFTNTRAGKALVRRFVAGDTLAEAIEAAKKLNRQGMKVSLDLLGEEVNSALEVEAALASYVACLDEMAASSIDGNVSIKLTQLGLAFDPDLARATLDRLAASAASVGLTVTIDMEDSTYTEETVDIYADAQPRHGNLGLALQAYLYRTADDLLRLMPLGGHLRLCKGAYVEPEAVAFQSTSEVDAAFARLLNVLMGFESVTPAVATHDPHLIDLARQLDHQRRQPFEFQMLYGVRPQAQMELAGAGYPIRIYVPYGSRWYPYLVRRLAERPANLGFFLRALFSR